MTTPQKSAGAQPPEDFTPPLRYPFLLGVYMATNAIPDAYAIIDGPDCLFFKAEFIHGKHDIKSTLLDVFGRHRIALTNVNAGNVAKSHGDAVVRKIRLIDAFPNSSVIFISSLPMVTIIGTQYDTLAREEQPNTTARIIDCPGRSLQGDWISGYTDVLNALAENIDISGGELDPKKVAVVGNLMDRTEGDHVGNVAEMERIVAGLGLELTTVWLGNQSYPRLCEIKNAGTILAFPLGRKAAKIIAKRTGAKVIEVDVPFGLARTRRMIDKLAKATETQDAAERFVAAELKSVIPHLEWIVPHLFIGKKLGFSASPDLLGGFVQIAEELGAEVAHLSAPCSPGHMAEDLGDESDTLPPVIFEPKQHAIKKEFERLSGLDLLLCNTELAQWSRVSTNSPGTAVIEFGFPSFFSHALSPRPYLGFKGWLCFVDRMANALMKDPANVTPTRQRSQPSKAPEKAAARA